MTPLIGLGIGQILGSVFGNVFGANQQAKAAEKSARIQAQTALQLADKERAALDEQLAYTRGIDARDYSDWLNREARDRKDWEISEQRKAPFRALADSAVRTLADYIRVPGTQPAQEVPVQVWTAPQQPASTTMPVAGQTLASYAQPTANALARYGRSFADYVR